MLDLTPLNLQIAQVLKEEILSGSLQPNQKISIEELSQRFGVSTTPVRDAIRTLESIGLVVISPRKSVTVASLDEKAIKDVFNLRIALECLAVELSIDHIPPKVIDTTLKENQTALDNYAATGDSEYLEKLEDYNVHQIVLKYCNNSKLVGIMDDINSLVIWARGVPVGETRSYDEAVQEHIQILKYLKSKQQQLAVQEMRSHLSSSCERTLTYWKENYNHS